MDFGSLRGGRVRGWTWYLCSRNTCCVYQIYASVDVCLAWLCNWWCRSRVSATSSWPLLLMLSVGPVRVPAAPPPGNTSLTLMPVWRLVACVGHYDGIIDGLDPLLWLGLTACLVFVMVNDGLWVTGVVAVSVVGPGTCVVVTLAVFTKFTPALYLPVWPCSWWCRSTFRKRPVGRCYWCFDWAVGTWLHHLAIHRWRWCLVCVWLPVLVTMMV